MEFVVIFAVPLLMLVWLISYLLKGRFKETTDGFKQAGVSVDYATGKVRVNRYEFDAKDVQSVQWSGGGGKYGNHSTAWIEVDDMNKPSHRLDFARSTDASDFVNRFRLAIKKAGGTELEFTE